MSLDHWLRVMVQGVSMTKKEVSSPPHASIDRKPYFIMLYCPAILVLDMPRGVDGAGYSSADHPSHIKYGAEGSHRRSGSLHKRPSIYFRATPDKTLRHASSARMTCASEISRGSKPSTVKVRKRNHTPTALSFLMMK